MAALIYYSTIFLYVILFFFNKGLEHYVKGKTYSFDEVLRLEPSEANGVVLQVEPVNKKTKKD